MIEEARDVARNARPPWPAEGVRTDADADAVLNHGCWFDVKAGEKVVSFFAKYLRHSKGKWAGKPFILLDWQRDDLIMPLFGWKRQDGFRRFQRAYIEIPKKNGKSCLCSGLALYFLTYDGENGAEVYCAADSRDQAGIVYNEARAMIDASPQLRRRLKPIDSKSKIIYQKTRSFYRALSREAGVSQGINASGFIFDELHTQKSRELWDSIEYSGEARDQPMLISITTAGSDQETICWEEHEHAMAVINEREFDHSYFALIYAAGPDDDWQDEATWFKANPSLGVTIALDKFREKVERAKCQPRKLNAFLRYRLNRWTQQETAWLNPEDWAACGSDFTREEMADED